MIDLTSLVDDIFKHAESQVPNECCGLAIIEHGILKYIPCNNLLSGNQFLIDPKDYTAAEDRGDIVGVCHSHVNCSPKPSIVDLASCESSKLPWIIVNYPAKLVETITPSGYKVPIIGRPYYYGSLDCFTIIRDYYKETCNIEINDYFRDVEWWLKGGNMYEDNFANEGFVEVPLSDIKIHDAILMKLNSEVSNHAAIYIGNNQIIHHRTNKLSSRDVYGGYWRKNTSKVLRHKSLL